MVDSEFAITILECSEPEQSSVVRCENCGNRTSLKCPMVNSISDNDFCVRFVLKRNMGCREDEKS